MNKGAKVFWDGEVIGYVDECGDTWVLYPDGSFGIELEGQPHTNLPDADEVTLTEMCSFAEAVGQIHDEPDLDVVPIVTEWFFGIYDKENGVGQLADRIYKGPIYRTLT